MIVMAQYLGHNGRYAAARNLVRQVFEARQASHGADHPDTLLARADLAFWIGQAEDPASARDQFAALVPVNVRVLGAEHPHTLAARSNLARWTGLAGDPAAARDQYAAYVVGGSASSRARAPTWPLDGRGRGPAAARDSRRCCRPGCGFSAPSTPIPSRSAPAWPTPWARRAIQPPPVIGTPGCYRCTSGSWGPSTGRRASSATTWPAGPGGRRRLGRGLKALAGDLVEDRGGGGGGVEGAGGAGDGDAGGDVAEVTPGGGQAGGLVADQEQGGLGEVVVEDVDLAVLVGGGQDDGTAPPAAPRPRP